MDDWIRIKGKAEVAAALMMQDRAEGERRFADLLDKHPKEPMVLVPAGWALAELGELEAGLSDLEYAATHFPQPLWRSIAQGSIANIRQRPSE